jgi:hypothetical protein
MIVSGICYLILDFRFWIFDWDRDGGLSLRHPKNGGARTGEPAYFIVFAIATIIFLLAAPMMAVVKGYAGLARMCRPARSARGSSTVCTQAIE